MGNWVVPASVLAGARFSVSPMAEVTGALGQLTRPADHVDRLFQSMHADAFAEMLREHPGRRAIVEHHWRPGWLVDFLCLPPPEQPTFERELAQVAERGDRRIRADLREISPTLPRILERPGVTEHVTGLLEWVWTRTLASDWPRRARVLEADIVARGARVASRGWAGVLTDLGRDRAWLATEGELRINRHDNPTRVLPDDASLQFVPTHWRASWTGFDLPDRFALYYPTHGRLADVGAPVRDGLDKLIGPNRAAILRALETPSSTSALSMALDLPVASVSGHLKVLLASGAVARRRNGREVLYWRDALGDGLVAAGEDGPARSEQQRAGGRANAGALASSP